VREADNLTTFMCQMSWKSGSLNLLEPSGPHQAYYGTPLPLPFSNASNDNGVSVGTFVTYKMYVGVKIIELAHETFIVGRHTTIMIPS
jgi:hypothetical protein